MIMMMVMMITITSTVTPALTHTALHLHLPLFVLSYTGRLVQRPHHRHIQRGRLTRPLHSVLRSQHHSPCHVVVGVYTAPLCAIHSLDSPHGLRDYRVGCAGVHAGVFLVSRRLVWYIVLELVVVCLAVVLVCG